VPDELKNVVVYWCVRRGPEPGRLEERMRALAEVPESEHRSFLRDLAERFVEVHERLKQSRNGAINRPSAPTG
jgi:hypothetical protein